MPRTAFATASASRQIAEDQLHMLAHVARQQIQVARPMRRVVAHKGAHVDPLADQQLHQMTADEPGGAGDQCSCAHAVPCL